MGKTNGDAMTDSHLDLTMLQVCTTLRDAEMQINRILEGLCKTTGLAIEIEVVDFSAFERANKNTTVRLYGKVIYP